jgi:hypothetical protein
VIRRGRKVLISTAELRRWVENQAERTLDQTFDNGPGGS